MLGFRNDVVCLQHNYKDMQAKLDNYPIEQQLVAQFAKLIAHPARVAIIQLLAERKACISGDISKEIPQLNRVTVSQHLQELKNFGLIKGEIDGVKVCYCLDNEKFKAMVRAFEALFHTTAQHIERNCC